MMMSDKDTEFTAVILAASFGSRLYPLTVSGDDEFEDHADMNEDNPNQKQNTSPEEESSSNNRNAFLPKHLLPLAGRPLIHHLVEKVIAANLPVIIVAIAAKDDVTISSLIEMGGDLQKNQGDEEETIVRNMTIGSSQLKVVQLPSECNGSADALRFISSLTQQCDMDDAGPGSDNDADNESSIIPSESHVIVMPGDLLLYGNLCSEEDGDTLATLVDEHRRNYQLSKIGEGPPLALTLVLTDVGEIDENGAPLKESAKAKKGGISREDEDIEYIALSEISPSSNSSRISLSAAKRIIIKQSKFIVEEDEDNIGKPPKLNIPKARLHSPVNQILIRTDWNDIHLFCFAPWVVKLIGTKINLKDLSKEVVPLLVESQFKGVKACLGLQNGSVQREQKSEDDKDETHTLQVLGQILTDVPFHQYFANSNISPQGENELNLQNMDSLDYPFTVLAHTLSHKSSKLILRTYNVPSYSYACREVVSQAIKTGSGTPTKLKLSIPKDASIDTKFNSIVLTSSLGEKVQIKSSTIGENVTVGTRCRLNNVVVMDDVTIGENCILQNSVLSKGCTLGDNCNLNDCQLGPKCLLPPSTRGKSESYVKDDIE